MSSKNTFIGVESLSKTLCNRLIPVGKTAEWIEKDGWITEADEMNSASQAAKEIMDDFYRQEIQKSLEMSQIEWEDYFEQLMRYRRDSQLEKELQAIQKEKRKEIRKLFEKRKDFTHFFKAELLKKVLPDFIDNYANYTSQERMEKKDIIKIFHQFTGVFLPYWENRINIFTDDAKTTSIGFRIVHENAEIFLDNILAFNRIEKDMMDEVEKIEVENAELFEEWNLKHVFSAAFYGFVLTQTGIDFYNNICGTINLHMNLYAQQNKISRIPYQMRKLHKQILSTSKSMFEIPIAFENDVEVYNAVNGFINILKQANVEKKCKEILENTNIYDYDKIYIKNKEYTNFSQKICSDWSILSEALKSMYDSKIKGTGKTKEEKVKQAIKNDKYRSLQSIEKLINENTKISITDMGKKYIELLLEIITECSWKEVKLDTTVKLIESEEKIQEVKNVLDGYIKLKDWLQQFLIEDVTEKDSYFYTLVNEIADLMLEIVPLYNRVRNYVTKKPYEIKKVKVHFGSPTLANGWTKSKEYDNNCVLFIRQGKYYLGIFNPRKKPDKKIMAGNIMSIDTSDYKKVEYYLLPGPNKMLPKVFFSKKGLEEFDPPTYILEGYEQKKHIKSNANFDIKFCHELIDYFKSALEKHPEWKKFEFKFSPTESYEDISGFYSEVAAQGYRINFVYISESDVERLVEEGSIYLFQIYNKDFAAGSKGNKNLHTLYFQYLFEEENLRDTVLKLNGEAEIFYRKASIQNPYVHKKGSVLVNKRYEEKKLGEKSIKKPIPEEAYCEIQAYLNHQCEELSVESKKWLEKCSYYEATMDIVKDKRYSIDQISFHCPITLNFKTQHARNVNELALSYIKQEEDLHIIGIDRGERNLIYISVINQNGEIVEQKSFNIVNAFDYKEKLNNMECNRQNARKNWKEIGKIKEVKEGYLSQVIHEICKLLLKYNAIIALEDLNYGFKRGRFKVEKQVYQKFETMLINKLNYLIDKNKHPLERGGLLRGYQMSYVPEKFTKLGKQCGVMFYVPAAYTSKIDPTTGFADIFAYKHYTSGKDRKEFLLSFDKIYYDGINEYFIFEFNYDNFLTYQNSFSKKKWISCTYGDRIEKKMVNGKIEDVIFNPTDSMKNVCKPFNYEDGHDLRDNIRNLDERKDLDCINQLFYCLKMTMQMRNSKTRGEYDRIISPIIKEDGSQFDSLKQNQTLPLDADANGAYHIALKGLYLVEKIKQLWEVDKKIPKDLFKITNEQWFEYMQNQNYKKE